MTDIDEQRIKSIMGDAWNVDTSEIPSDVAFSQFLPWDSVGHMALMIGLENELNLEINYEMLTELTSMGAIINYVLEKRKIG